MNTGSGWVAAIGGGTVAIAIAFASSQVNDRIERHQCDRQIGGVCRDALVARSKDRLHSIDPIDSAAAAAGRALVACSRHIAEVRTARALENIAADRRHVAQLRRSALFERTCDHRKSTANGGMKSDIGHASERTDV